MRKLKIGETNITVGGEVYRSGTILTEAEAHPTLVQAASTGRLVNGFRLATWMEQPKTEPAKPADTMKENEAPAAPEAPVEEPAKPAEASLADLIKTLVREGESKTAVVESLGASDKYTQREVRAEFDRMLETGEIIAGAKSGDYTVA